MRKDLLLFLQVLERCVHLCERLVMGTRTTPDQASSVARLLQFHCEGLRTPTNRYPKRSVLLSLTIYSCITSSKLHVPNTKIFLTSAMPPIRTSMERPLLDDSTEGIELKYHDSRLRVSWARKHICCIIVYTVSLLFYLLSVFLLWLSFKTSNCPSQRPSLTYSLSRTLIS